MLRQKELQELKQRQEDLDKKQQMFQMKYLIQNQMQEKEQQRQEAYQEYLREKEQVDRIVQRMIDEDLQYMQMTKQKQDQAKSDMVMSVQEKNEMKKR